jgi:glutathione peroxidase
MTGVRAAHPPSRPDRYFMTASIYGVPLQSIDGKPTSLKPYEGKVLLVVNVASKCGLTPQYEGLETLYAKYRARGLEVLGFPANEFGAQEPGTDAEIKTFCETSYKIDFPMFSKIVVKGPQIHPLYQLLTSAQPLAREKTGSDFKAQLQKYGVVLGEPHEIAWNFEKFLVSRDGRVVARFAPDVTPGDPIVTEAVEAQLGA